MNNEEALAKLNKENKPPLTDLVRTQRKTNVQNKKTCDR